MTNQFLKANKHLRHYLILHAVVYVEGCLFFSLCEFSQQQFKPMLQLECLSTFAVTICFFKSVMLYCVFSFCLALLFAL